MSNNVNFSGSGTGRDSETATRHNASLDRFRTAPILIACPNSHKIARLEPLKFGEKSPQLKL